MHFYTVPASQRKNPQGEGLPVTKNKIRDSKIIDLYLNEHWKMEDIAKRFGISAMRVSKIIRTNAELLKHKPLFEKVKRVNRLERILASMPDQLSKRHDVIDVLAQLREEHEGKGNSVNIVNQNNVNVSVGLSNLIEKFHADRLQS